MQKIKALMAKVKVPGFVVVFIFLLVVLASLGYALGQPLHLVNIPALSIVVFGTIVATSLSFSLADLKEALMRVKNAKKISESEVTADANQLLHFSQLWFRKQYSLIDRDIEALKNPFLKKGLQMIRDRQDPEDVKALMSWKIAHEGERDLRAVQIIQNMVSNAPVFGLIGTIVGVLSLLNGFDAAKGFEALLVGISIAFVSTLYGLLFAYLALKPWSIKLEQLRAQKIKRLAMLAEGVAMIEQKRSPAEIRDILIDYIESMNRELALENSTAQPGLSRKNSNASGKPFLLKFGA